MHHDDSVRQHPVQSDGTTRAIANMQWHDAELAMTVARHSFERWLAAGHKDTPPPAVMHAYHAHTALQEAARAITVLIETFRAEATALRFVFADSRRVNGTLDPGVAHTRDECAGRGVADGGHGT